MTQMLADFPFVRRQSRAGRSLVWVLGLMAGITALLLLVMGGYLLPAMDAARTADAAGKRQLSAWSMLVLAVVFACLLMGLILSLRMRRYFVVPGTTTRVKTEYVDAWAESAKRMTVEKDPVQDDEEDSDGKA